MMSENKILIVGLGNPILGDDGVGWRVAELVQEKVEDHSHIHIEFLSLGGLSLMEHLIGYDHVILIDAIVTGNNPMGTVNAFPLDHLPNRALGHLTSAHDTTLQNALLVGLSMGAHLPKDIFVVTVESENVFDFSEELTPDVKSAVPKAVKKVLEYIDEIESFMNLSH